MVRPKTETAVLIFLAAILYWLGYQFQGWLFQFTEHVPGVKDGLNNSPQAMANGRRL